MKKTSHSSETWSLPILWYKLEAEMIQLSEIAFRQTNKIAPSLAAYLQGKVCHAQLQVSHYTHSSESDMFTQWS